MFHLQESFISALNSCSSWQWGLWQSQTVLQYLTLQILLLKLERLPSITLQGLFICYWLFRLFARLQQHIFTPTVLWYKKLNCIKDKGDRVFVIFLPGEFLNFFLIHFSWPHTNNVAPQPPAGEKMLLCWGLSMVVQHCCCVWDSCFGHSWLPQIHEDHWLCSLGSLRSGDWAVFSCTSLRSQFNWWALWHMLWRQGR